MAFSFTPQAQQQPSLFQTPGQQQSSPFGQFLQQQQFQFQQQQQQQQQFQLQQQQQFQQQQQQSQQQQLYLFTNDKTPATYSTKWADLHPDSQKLLLRIEERILEYRDESQRLDQCSRLYDSSVASDGFELDASRSIQELGGVGTSMERQKAILQELMAVKDMLRNTEVAVRSFMMLRARFLHQSASSATAPSQASGATIAPTAPTQAQSTPNVLVFDFYRGIPKKPSPFLQQTVERFEKYLVECRQWVEELEQLILLDSERNSVNSNSSLLQSLPKVMSNVHDFFVHVAAKVESIHQYIESMKTGEATKHEAAARRVQPTLHLSAISQPSTQVAGLISSSAAAGTATAAQTSGVSMAQHVRFCKCGDEAILVTSWSIDNPARRFFGCSNSEKYGSSGCDYFCWFDPPTPAPARICILGLLKKKKEYEELVKLQQKQKNWKRLFMFLLFLFVMFILYGAK